MGMAVEVGSATAPPPSDPIPSLAATCAVVFFHIWERRPPQSKKCSLVSGTRRKRFRQFCEQFLLSTVTFSTFFNFDRKSIRNDALTSDEAAISIRLNEAMTRVTTLSMIALKYVDRFRRDNPYVDDGDDFEHRVFASAFILAQKMYEDHVFGNTCWAEATGFSRQQILDCEVQFLLGVDFDLTVDNLDDWCVEVQSRVAWYGLALGVGSGASKVMEAHRFNGMKPLGRTATCNYQEYTASREHSIGSVYAELDV